MSNTTTRIALAAVLAALSAPAFAGDTETPFPATENPSPAVTVYAQGGEAEALVRADPTWPEADSAAPAFALVAHPDSSPLLDPAPAGEPAPTVHYAIELAPKARRVAETR